MLNLAVVAIWKTFFVRSFYTSQFSKTNVPSLHSESKIHFASCFLRSGRQLLVLWTQTPQTAALCTSTMLRWPHFLPGSAGTTAPLLPTLCPAWCVPVCLEGITAASWLVSLLFLATESLWWHFNLGIQWKWTKRLIWVFVSSPDGMWAFRRVCVLLCHRQGVPHFLSPLHHLTQGWEEACHCGVCNCWAGQQSSECLRTWGTALWMLCT